MAFPGLPRLLSRIRPLRQPGRRLTVAIVGAPGSGKSTIADAIREALVQQGITAEILPMDGFHHDNAILAARGLRARKGAPETFDVAGFAHLLDRLRRNDEAEIAVPVFDRRLDLSRSCARLIAQEVEVLLVEGNYLLLDLPGWRDLAAAFDLTVLLDVPEEMLRQRLYDRWRGHDIPEADIPAKVEANDLPNGVTVITRSRKADVTLSPDELVIDAPRV